LPACQHHRHHQQLTRDNNNNNNEMRGWSSCGGTITYRDSRKAIINIIIIMIMIAMQFPNPCVEK